MGKDKDVDGGGNTGGGGADNSAAGMKTYNQADLDRMFGERASQAERGLLKKLGFERIEDAQSSLEKLRELEDSQKSEADKQRDKIAELERANIEHLQQRQEYVTEYEIRLAASRLGIIDPEAAYKLVDLARIEYDDGKPKNIDKVLAELVKTRPYLLGAHKSSGDAGAGTGGGQTGHENINAWIRRQAGRG